MFTLFSFFLSLDGASLVLHITSADTVSSENAVLDSSGII